MKVSGIKCCFRPHWLSLYRLSLLLSPALMCCIASYLQWKHWALTEALRSMILLCSVNINPLSWACLHILGTSITHHCLHLLIKPIKPIFSKTRLFSSFRQKKKKTCVLTFTIHSVLLSDSSVVGQQWALFIPARESLWGHGWVISRVTHSVQRSIRNAAVRMDVLSFFKRVNQLIGQGIIYSLAWQLFSVI